MGDCKWTGVFSQFLHDELNSGMSFADRQIFYCILASIV